MSGRRSLAVALLVLSIAGGARALDIGGVAADFEAPTIQGDRFSLSKSERDHAAVVVLFVSTLCPYSNYYDDLLRDMASRYASRGVVFVGINSSRVETLDEIREHAHRHGHTFPIVRDGDGKLAELFDARRTPEVFLLDGGGKLRYRGRIASKISSPDLQNALDQLLAGHEVKPAETKAFGCAIPRS